MSEGTNTNMIDRTKLRSALQAGPDCLSPVELERLAGENSDAKHLHLGQCSRCKSELAMLRAFQSSAPLPDEGAAVAWITSTLERRLDEIKSGSRSTSQHRSDTSKASWWGSRLFTTNLRWALLAGSAVAVAVASLLWLRASQEPELRADSGSGPAIYRSIEVEVLTPAGTLAQIPQTLRWKPVAGASRYRVTFMEIDKIPFSEMTINDVSMTTPGSAISKLRVGKPLLWQVAALDAQGRVIASSQLERISVRQGESR